MSLNNIIISIHGDILVREKEERKDEVSLNSIIVFIHGDIILLLRYQKHQSYAMTTTCKPSCNYLVSGNRPNPAICYTLPAHITNDKLYAAIINTHMSSLNNIRLFFDLVLRLLVSHQEMSVALSDIIISATASVKNYRVHTLH